jgi:uncharacterized membrane protein YgcG
MEVEATTAAANRRRARWPYRLAEGAGLVILIYGLAASAWWIAIGGAAIIIAAYATYPRKHRRSDDGDGTAVYLGSDGHRDRHDRDRRDDDNDADDSSGDSGGGDSGGDGGGGD